MTRSRARVVTWNEGREILNEGITHLRNIFEGKPTQLKDQDHGRILNILFRMCRQQKPPHNYTDESYNLLKESVEDYIISTVRPSLDEKSGELFLRELINGWENHKEIMRYFNTHYYFQTLEEAVLHCFDEVVYNLKGKLVDAVISMIKKDRDGYPVDHVLLKNIVEVVLKIDNGRINFYKTVLEEAILNNICAYYSITASSWIRQYFFLDYILKGEEFLQAEENRTSQYLPFSSVAELMERARHEVFTAYWSTLLVEAPYYVSKAPIEDVEYFCKNGASGCSARLLALFYVNILMKGTDEKSIDDDKHGKETLNKVLKLVAFSSDKDVFAEVYWQIINEGITKLRNIFEGKPDELSDHDHTDILNIVYQMCRQEPPLDYFNGLHDLLKDSVEDYIISSVRPSLEKYSGEILLRELVNGWSNHKELMHSFNSQTYFQTLEEDVLPCFCEVVYNLGGKVVDAVISLIDKERDGCTVDQILLKDIVDITIRIDNGQMTYYKNFFEETMLKATSAYYSSKTLSWLGQYVFFDYILKAEEFLRNEEDITSRYLHSSSRTELVKRVRHELFTVYWTILLEKAPSYVKKAPREDVEVFCKNGASGSSPGLLAIFCDNVLRKGDEHSDKVIDKVLKLVAFIS